MAKCCGVRAQGAKLEAAGYHANERRPCTAWFVEVPRPGHGCRFQVVATTNMMGPISSLQEKRKKTVAKGFVFSHANRFGHKKKRDFSLEIQVFLFKLEEMNSFVITQKIFLKIQKKPNLNIYKSNLMICLYIFVFFPVFLAIKFDLMVSRWNLMVSLYKLVKRQGFSDTIWWFLGNTWQLMKRQGFPGTIWWFHLVGNKFDQVLGDDCEQNWGMQDTKLGVFADSAAFGMQQLCLSEPDPWQNIQAPRFANDLGCSATQPSLGCSAFWFQLYPQNAKHLSRCW